MASTRTKKKRSRREEEELENAYRSISRSGSKKKKKSKKSNRGAGIAACVIALLAVVLCVAAGYIYFYQADMDGIILENVSVAGVDVGGMRQADAIEAVKAATRDTFGIKAMVVQINEDRIEIPGNCVSSFNVRGAVRAAYKFGNSGSAEKQKQEQSIALTKGYAVDLIPYLNIKESAIRSYLEQLGKNYNTALNQSQYEVTGEYPAQVLVVKLGTPEYGLNLNDLYNEVLAAYSNNIFLVETSCGMIAPEPIDLEAIQKEYYQAPVDARFNPENYEVIEGEDGYGLDLESAKRKLDNAAYGSTVQIPFVKLPPAITGESLKAILYRDTLATYTAKADSSSDRDINLQLACNSINGIVILPKDVFSFNDTLGERTATKGYRPGPSFSGGKTVMTIGGGICQVSSALYYCVLSSELEVLVRENHSYYPGYVPLGMDAVVSWGSKDFRFRNTTDYPIRIEAEASGGTVTIKLMGTDTRNYRVELEYEQISKTDYTVSYETYPKNNAEGYKNGQYITEPYTGYNVKTYRVKYDKATGEQTARDYIDQSNYKVRNGVVCRIEGSADNGIGGGNISDEPGILP